MGARYGIKNFVDARYDAIYFNHLC